jgi:Putative adhesin
MRTRTIALLLVCSVPLMAQQQPDFRWEKALAAGSTVSLHNLNGDITVTPSTSGKVEIVGVKHGNKRYYDEITLEIFETPRGITVCSMFKNMDMDCDDRGFHSHDHHRNRDWDDLQIDIEVKLPKGLEVDAHNVSGNVSIVGAEGDVRAGSVSGDVRMERLRVSSLKASSVSGDVTVGIDALTGSGPLKFTSVSGNVTAELPKGTEADVTMRSVSGSLDSDFPLTLNGRVNRRSIEARIGRGGREIEVHTVSGDVRLRAAK